MALFSILKSVPQCIESQSGKFFVDKEGIALSFEPSKDNELIIEDTEFQKNYFYHTNKIKDVEFALIYEDFKHPVCIDKNGEILKLNDFPADITLHTFLLDNENKVLAIGNPIYNESIAKLYIDFDEVLFYNQELDDIESAVFENKDLRQELKKEEKILKTIEMNIDNYDGTGENQQDIPR